MSDLYEDDDNDSRLVKDLRRQLREHKAKVDELTEQNTTLSTQVRSKSVEEILASKGADKRLAKYIPSDVNDEAGVTAWLDSDGDLFGYKKDDGDGSSSGSDGLSPEAVEAAQRVQQASAGGVVTADRQKQQLDAVRNATTKEELDALVFGAQSG